ncbi:MAG: lysophospholipid acyltransferase family protein [Actinomycetota bacterium]
MPARNVFGQPLWLKKKVFQTLDLVTRAWMFRPNKLTATGMDRLDALPAQGVLFVSNHQTVFTDVIAMYHTFLANDEGADEPLPQRRFLRNPKLNLYFIAARETMTRGLLPRIMAVGGAVLVDRTWRDGDKNVDRAMRLEDVDAIGTAINDGWVVTFPQGTTRPGAPVRKGTAHIIKQYRPVVIPIRVSGFRDAFDKTGLKRKRKGVRLNVEIREPMTIDPDSDSVDDIVGKITDAIAA